MLYSDRQQMLTFLDALKFFFKICLDFQTESFDFQIQFSMKWE